MSKRYDDNIQNTDNQDTMLLPDGLESYQKPQRQELPPLKKKSQAAPQPVEKINGERVYKQNPSQTSEPPQFPQSSPPPPMHRQSGQYYDYNQQPPQSYNGYSSSSHSVPPVSSPTAPPPPPRTKQPTAKKQPRPAAPEPEHKPKKKKHKSPVRKLIGRIIKILVVLFLVVFGVYSCTSLSLISKMNHVESGSRHHYADSVGRSHVRSVLVIGTDGRTADDRGRSDSMILVSLNSKTDELIMTSFMRDCYVEIPDYGWNKLNAAYAFGGPELLMDTIEYNFDVRIDDYITIDFASFVSVVDSVGGIDLKVSDAEAEEINIILMAEVNELMGDDRMSDLLSGGGKLHLNGKQALAYSRIRNVGNNDFERTERQRRVMSLIFAKLKSFKPSMFKNLASDVIPDVTTNMSTIEAYLLSLRLPFAVGYSVKQIQIPAEGTFYGDDVDVGNVLQIDRDENSDIIDREVFAK